MEWLKEISNALLLGGIIAVLVDRWLGAPLRRIEKHLEAIQKAVCKGEN